MAKMFKYTGLIALMIFSFYYTEKTALFVKSKTPLMQEITKEIDNNNVSSVNAIVSNDYIIPGINGLSVNASKSYVNMKKLGKYNAYYLVFDQVSPKLSVESNKDKIINKGNSKKNGVAIILEKKDNEIAQYFIDNDLKVNLLINLDDYTKNSFFEQINNDKDNFVLLDKKLKSAKLNNELCIVSDSIKDQCVAKNKYLIEPTYTLTNSNIASIKNKINSGSIILLKENLSKNNLLILLEQIKYHDLAIMPLSSLISEYNYQK